MGPLTSGYVCSHSKNQRYQNLSSVRDNIEHNNNNILVALKYPDWCPAGNSHISRAGEALFSLGWQSPINGASIKHTGVSAT